MLIALYKIMRNYIATVDSKSDENNTQIFGFDVLYWFSLRKEKKERRGEILYQLALYKYSIYIYLLPLIIRSTL